MQRRNLLIGMGSLAAGGAATIGTGAFTSVSADRQVDVQVASDTNAYLGLEPVDTANGAYAEDVGNNKVAVDFNDIDDGNSTSGNVTTGGSGVNPDANTVAKSVFKITNQGTQSVEVSLEANGSDDLDVQDPSDISAPGSDGINAALSTDVDQLSSDSTTDTDGSVQVDAGESVEVDFAINSPITGSLSGELTISADAV